MIVIRDSSTIINLVISKAIPTDYVLASIISRVYKESNKFEKLLFHQVLRKNHKEAYKHANKATKLKEGAIFINGNEGCQPIP
jgi:hypothetical protein